MGHQRPHERTLPSRLSLSISAQQFLGSLSQHPSHFPPLAFDSGNLQRVVGGGLVPHPRNNCSLRRLFDGNAFRPGNRPASNRRGMISHRTGKPLGEIQVDGMEGQESEDRPVEILDVLGLGFFPASASGLFPFDVRIGGSLGFEFSPNLFNGR